MTNIEDRVLATVAEHGPLTWTQIHRRLGDVGEEELDDIPGQLAEQGRLHFTRDGFIMPDTS